MKSDNKSQLTKYKDTDSNKVHSLISS